MKMNEAAIFPWFNEDIVRSCPGGEDTALLPVAFLHLPCITITEWLPPLTLQKVKVELQSAIMPISACCHDPVNSAFVTHTCQTKAESPDRIFANQKPIHNSWCGTLAQPKALVRSKNTIRRSRLSSLCPLNFSPNHACTLQEADSAS